jgi:hypothetical protein
MPCITVVIDGFQWKAPSKYDDSTSNGLALRSTVSAPVSSAAPVYHGLWQASEPSKPDLNSWQGNHNAVVRSRVLLSQSESRDDVLIASTIVPREVAE